jgi:hypothetical protein
VQPTQVVKDSALNSALLPDPRSNEVVWDPMGFLQLGSGEAMDTFPNMFPNEQYLRESEIKQGRQGRILNRHAEFDVVLSAHL